MYQIGQAVISNNNDLLYFIYNIEAGGSQKYIYLSKMDGFQLPIPCYDNEVRPATQAEILEEAQRNGWEHIDGDWYSPSQQLWIFKEYPNQWDWHNIFKIKDLNAFGNECIVAHRLITALKLAL